MDIEFGPGGNILAYAVIILLSGGGATAIVQIFHYFRARVRDKPEIDSIIAEGAKNAVEALQGALAERDGEISRLRAEIDRLTGQLESAQSLLDAAHTQINQLSKDLARLRDEVHTGMAPADNQV